MFNNALRYAETALITAAVSAPAHYLGLDWPWSIAIGLLVSIVLRALVHRRASANFRQEIRP